MNAIITVVGTDQVGIIAKVSAYLVITSYSIHYTKLYDGIGETRMTAETGIIVTEIQKIEADGAASTLVIGVFSEMVQKVISIEPEDIEPPPKIGIAIDTDFIVGVITSYSIHYTKLYDSRNFSIKSA